MGIILLGIGGLWTRYLITLNKKWKLKISFESDEDKEEQVRYTTWQNYFKMLKIAPGVTFASFSATLDY
jgi:hypothetical protein